MVTTLIIPVAGLGKRLLPLTLQTPKNLIPLHGRPILEYVLAETKGTTIRDVVLVVGPQHEEAFRTYVRNAQARFPGLTFHFRVQDEPYGNGHALLQAYDLVRGEPFAVRFPDDILCDEVPMLHLLLERFNHYRKTIIALEQIPIEDVGRYGVVKAESVSGEADFLSITGIIEKPSVAKAPSNLIIIGAYVITPAVLDYLRQFEKDMEKRNDALWLVDGFTAELKNGGAMYGLQFSGKRLDCGTLEGLQAAEAFIAAHPDCKLS